MIITIYTPFSIDSLFAALFWTSVFTKILSLLRKKTSFLQHYSLHALLFLLLLCLLRLLLPLKPPFSLYSRSKKVLPALQAFCNIPLFYCGALCITPGFLFACIWVVTAAVLLIRHIREYMRLKRLLDLLPVCGDARLYSLLAQADLRRRHRPIRIIVHSSVAAPATAGFFHPVILLPDFSFDDDELFGIFLHETAHLHFKHHLIKLVTELACICFWWNPLLKDLYTEITHALEMHSDQAVCKSLNQEQQKKYLQAIVKIFQHQSRTNAASAFTYGLMEHADGGELQQRFRMILEGRYRSKSKSLLLVAVLTLCIFLSSYTIIPWPFSEPTAEDYGYTEPPPTDKYFYVETEDGYDVYIYPDIFQIHLPYKPLEPHLQGPAIYKSLAEAKRK